MKALTNLYKKAATKLKIAAKVVPAFSKPLNAAAKVAYTVAKKCEQVAKVVAAAKQATATQPAQTPASPTPKKTPKTPAATPKEESPQEEVTREDTGGFKYEEAAEKMYEYVNKQLSEEYPDNYIPGSIKIGSYFEKDASEFGAGAANVLKDVTFAVPFAALGAKAGAMYIGAHATGGAVATDLTVKAAGVIAGVAGGSITQRLLGLPDVLPGKTYQYNIMAEFKTGFAGGFNIYTVDIHESGRVIMEQARIG